MMLHPEVQRKAQAEIDSVVGKDRLPDFADRDNLPYVEAVVKELIRFHTVIPAGACFLMRAVNATEFDPIRRTALRHSGRYSKRLSHPKGHCGDREYLVGCLFILLLPRFLTS